MRIGVVFTPKICDFGLCREGMVSTNNNAEGVGSGDGTGGEDRGATGGTPPLARHQRTQESTKPPLEK